MKKITLIYVFVFISLMNGFAQDELKAVKVENPPVIDGIVNDQAWEKASVVDNFFQREPVVGAPASEKTEFLVCYDAHNIYFGIKCWDEREDITAKEMARDVSLGNDDRIQIILDTYDDDRNGYWFQIGPRGSIGDALISENGAAFNKQWDGLWDGKARFTSYGWEAEMIIPFKTLSFDEHKDQWGIKFIRHIVKNLESSYWPEANLNTYRFQVSDAGVLTGIEGITQGIGLDVSPYLITGADMARGLETDKKLDAGVDLFYQITPSLKSSLSINTDFAETEVDDRQINLTRFNLHFPEKRDFFLDGANYFQFGLAADDASPVSKRIIPFFSRRMGLNEQGEPVAINAAAKLTGQVQKWNIGMMYINDNSSNGSGNYAVARISRNLWKQSSVGFIGTGGNALTLHQNRLAGFDFNLATSSFGGNKNASLLLFGLKSFTENYNGNDASWGGQIRYPNDLIDARLGYHRIEKNFIAGMGFVPRRNIRESYGEITFGPRPNAWGIMQLLWGGAFDWIANLETGITETREYRISPLGVRFRSGEEFRYTILNQYEMLPADFYVFSDYIIPGGTYQWWKHQFRLATKGARNLWGSAGYGYGGFYNGNRKDLDIQVNWKVAVPLFLGGSISRNYVTLPAGSFTADVYQSNLNILFSPKITLYNFIQYDNFTNTAGIQSRFQWIVKPGNEIILAWTSILTDPNEHYTIEQSSVRLKIKYNIRF